MLSVPKFLWTHKFKTVFAIFILILGRKIWYFWTTWVKPFLDIYRGNPGEQKLPQATTADQGSPHNLQGEDGRKTGDLYKIANENKDKVTQIKIF